jgi:hypothetical protein
MHLVGKRRQAVGNGPDGNANVNVNQIRRYAYYTRWRSHLFITEINGKDRKKQKLLPAAGYGNANRPTATLMLTLTLTSHGQR